MPAMLWVAVLTLAGLKEWEVETYKRNETGEVWCSEVGATTEEAVTDEGVRSVLANGLLRVNDVIKDEEAVGVMLGKVEEIMPRNEGESANHHHNIAVRIDAAVRKVMENTISNTYDLLKGLVTENGKLVELAIMINDPGATYQKWHADTVWEPEAAKLYSFFIALDNVTLDMGPTALVPRTHLKPFIDKCNDEVSKTRKPICSAAFEPLPKIAATLQPGDMMVMDSVLQHRANSNVSTKRRRLIYFSLAGPGSSPEGSTYTLHPGYTGLRLKDYKNWHKTPAHSRYGIDTDRLDTNNMGGEEF